jgi:16S rRNA (cytosine967-C5)-methyltransferase
LTKLPSVPGLAPRLAAATRLRTVLGGDNFLPHGAAELADSRERALANRLVTTALRRHGQLTAAIATLLEKGLPKKSGPFEAVLRLSLAQLLFLPELGDHSALFLGVEAIKRDGKIRHLAGLMNAVLRRAQAEAELLREQPAATLFPPGLAARWLAQYGDVIEAFGAALVEGAPLDLTLKHDSPALVELLGGESIGADTVRLVTRDAAVADLPGYAEGRWWVQDAAAAIPARLLQLPRDARVLDLCAAPGGKTAQLVKAGYRVTALDNDTGRLERLRDNLKRLGMVAEVVTADGTTYQPRQLFDGIVLDAPCSATGTFRRHPEVVWHRSTRDIAGRVALQRRFISHAARLLAPGGMLVYCVCSLEPEEGEEQAAWIAATLPDLEAVPISAGEIDGYPETILRAGVVRSHPAIPLGVSGGKPGTMDGFFVARFRRR